MELSALSLLARRVFDDPRLEPARLGAALRGRAAGLPLRAVAGLLGVHVATLCRWQKRCPELRAALAEAAGQAGSRRRCFAEPRPAVRWRKDCPECRARVV